MVQSKIFHPPYPLHFLQIGTWIQRTDQTQVWSFGEDWMMVGICSFIRQYIISLFMPLTGISAKHLDSLIYWGLQYVEILIYYVSSTECLCPLKILCWNPAPQCDNIKRWDLWEVIRIKQGYNGGAHMTGIDALIRELASSFFLSCKYTKRSWLSATWKRPSLKPNHAGWHPDLKFPTSKTMRNKRLLFTPHILK